jgi:hypothetical protein
MDSLVFFVVLCTSGVLFAAFVAVREQRRSALSGAGYRMIGLLTCLVWPFVALACVLSGLSQVGQGA